MKISEVLLSKNGYVAIIIAKEFLKCNVGEKVPTVTQLSEKYQLARGTVQNALKSLQKYDAIRLDAKGHKGSYLVKKNMPVLLKFAGINSIVGVMPLPYSKRYEGLASGLMVTLENFYNIPASMAFMRGARNRIGMLLSDRYDFAIISKLAAQRIIDEDGNIIIALSFGPYSYLSEHVIIFSSEKHNEIEDGMRVGIDNDSVDQKILTEEVCKDKKVEYVNYGYSQILQRVIQGDIDAAIWNKDEIDEKLCEVKYHPIETIGSAANEAVLVVSKEKPELASLLEEIIDPKTVTNIQQLVLKGRITPSY
ncbi:MAG: GntR family transcriptional regulator YhfZ [Erysipelotrichaceae bacterium]|jgi:hypothetical protein